MNEESKRKLYLKLAPNYDKLLNEPMAEVLYENKHNNKSLEKMSKNTQKLKKELDKSNVQLPIPLFEYPIAFAHFSKKITKHDYINMKNNQISCFNYR